MRTATEKQRRETAIDMLKKGKSRREITLLLGMNYRTLNRIIEQCKVGTRQTMSKISPERADKVVALFKEGHSRKDIMLTMHMDIRNVNRCIKDRCSSKDIDTNLALQRSRTSAKATASRYGETWNCIEREKKALEMWHNGNSCNQIRKELHLSSNYLRRLLLKNVGAAAMKEHHTRQLRKNGNKAVSVRFGSAIERMERIHQMQDMREQGRTLSQIAESMNMSRAGVSVALMRAAAKPKPAPKPVAVVTVSSKMNKKPQLPPRDPDTEQLCKEQHHIYMQMLNCSSTSEYLMLARKYSELQMKIEYHQTCNSVRRDLAVSMSAEQHINL